MNLRKAPKVITQDQIVPIAAQSVLSKMPQMPLKDGMSPQPMEPVIVYRGQHDGDCDCACGLVN